MTRPFNVLYFHQLRSQSLISSSNQPHLAWLRRIRPIFVLNRLCSTPLEKPGGGILRSGQYHRGDSFGAPPPTPTNCKSGYSGSKSYQKIITGKDGSERIRKRNSRRRSVEGQTISLNRWILRYDSQLSIAAITLWIGDTISWSN